MQSQKFTLPGSKYLNGRAIRNFTPYAFRANSKENSGYRMYRYMALGVSIGSLTFIGKTLADSPYEDIYYAAKLNHVKKMRELLTDYPHYINKGLDKHDSTPLHIAAEYADSEMITLLLEKGAAINKQQHFSAGAIHIATDHGNIGIVRTLLLNNADVNLRDLSNGWTALHYAASHNYLQTAELLLRYNADKTITSYWNFWWGSQTPYDCATSAAMRELLR